MKEKNRFSDSLIFTLGRKLAIPFDEKSSTVRTFTRDVNESNQELTCQTIKSNTKFIKGQKLVLGLFCAKCIRKGYFRGDTYVPSKYDKPKLFQTYLVKILKISSCIEFENHTRNKYEYEFLKTKVMKEVVS